MMPASVGLITVMLLVYCVSAYLAGIAEEIRKEIRWKRRGYYARWLMVRRPIPYEAWTNEHDMIGRLMPGLVSESYAVATIGRDAVSAGLADGSLEDTGRHHYVTSWSNSYTGKAWPKYGPDTSWL